MKTFSVVTVANENSAPQIRYEIQFDDGLRTFAQASEKAIEHAKSLGNSYRFVAVGITDDARSQRLRALDTMGCPVWLNGDVTRKGV